MTTTRGFITLAFGEKYAEMALDLALSVKEFHDEPISIAVDQQAARRLQKYTPSPFDEVVVLDDRVHPWGAKFLVVDACPYDEAAFIDCDIVFLRQTEFLERSFETPLSMYGAYMKPDADFRTYYHSSEIFAAFGLDRYFWATSGIFFFNKELSRDFFQQCYDFYTTGIKAYPRYSTGAVADELVFGVMSNDFDITRAECPTVHPWPMADDMLTIKPSDNRWPVFHVFGPVNESYMEHLLQMITARREQFRFPQRSTDIWRNKANSTPSLWDKLCHVARRAKRRLQVGGRQQ